MEELEVKNKPSLLLFAEEELARIPKDADGMQEDINKHILDMVRVFCDENHLGTSARYTVSLLNRLLLCLPLTPIEDVTEEWRRFDTGVEQHMRCSSIFRDLNRFDGKAYHIEARVFSEDGGETWFYNKNSSMVIDFPYYVPEGPKRYLIAEDGSFTPYEE